MESSERYLRCQVMVGCESGNSIDTATELYYVLGGGTVINCRACAERRGWHLLPKWALEKMQRTPISNP